MHNADDLFEEYKQLTAGTKFVQRGILNSEAFFVYAKTYPYLPEQVIESGRAQGQSTFLFSKIFPETRVISIEREHSHPDAHIALDKLKGISNVSCLFGDSMKIIPEIAQEDDILVIDGPKDLKALLLTIKVCRKKLPKYVFIHDAYKGSILRTYLERNKPNALYSDEPEFLENFCSLDDWKDETEQQFWSNPRSYPTEKVYGGTFACLGSDSLNFNFSDLILIYIYKARNNLVRSARKRLGANYVMRHPCE
jgi:hypothetical protein